MSDKVVYETARQAAAYWAESLRSRARWFNNSNKTLANKNRVIVLSSGQKKALDEDSIVAYENALAELISEHLEQNGTIEIVTGFGADGLLIQAANRIGYEVTMLSVPYKTRMVVTLNEVKVNSVHRRTQL